MFLIHCFPLQLKNELHAAATMANEASRPDLDFMAPEYSLRGGDADALQVIITLSLKLAILQYYLI